MNGLTSCQNANGWYKFEIEKDSKTHMMKRTGVIVSPRSETWPTTHGKFVRVCGELCSDSTGDCRGRWVGGRIAFAQFAFEYCEIDGYFCRISSRKLQSMIGISCVVPKKCSSR